MGSTALLNPVCNKFIFRFLALISVVSSLSVMLDVKLMYNDAMQMFISILPLTGIDLTLNDVRVGCNVTGKS